ncbi:hypothetical protein C5B42_03215 [Candidatus Cerribacteria bacterium 'Amazon FNV 2010 28 9']|uniref:Uncharacterized protein n=1 Tax=Candidatus Cerribacteria bacterium 'Amazon FNV 2010 28 9' TaxID=2081795 RepID=A0A317JNP8_9BACT|nr:MAG: hypothetical protein C5B42_03215 [Candidatus Cerribacteria bacterium 'Amazon FNV 2010 28 9']
MKKTTLTQHLMTVNSLHKWQLRLLAGFIVAVLTALVTTLFVVNGWYRVISVLFIFSAFYFALLFGRELHRF